MADLTPTGRAEMRRLEKAATRKPWHRLRGSLAAYGSVDTYDGPVLGTIIRFEDTSQCDGDGRVWSVSGSAEANLAYVVAACEALPAALDRIEELEAALREAKALVAGLQADFDGVTDNPDDPSRMHTWSDLDRHGWFEKYDELVKGIKP